MYLVSCGGPWSTWIWALYKEKRMGQFAFCYMLTDSWTSTISWKMLSFFCCMFLPPLSKGIVFFSERSPSLFWTLLYHMQRHTLYPWLLWATALHPWHFTTWFLTITQRGNWFSGTTRWPSHLGCELILQDTSVWFSSPTSDSSVLPLSPALGNLQSLVASRAPAH